jgi:hypothetical protein
MLDPGACAGMGFGAPHVAISALVELHHLLIESGFRQSSRDDLTIVQEEQDERSLPTPALLPAAPRQLSMPFDPGRLRGVSPAERSTALVRLASLLLEAAGVAAGEPVDDER